MSPSKYRRTAHFFGLGELEGKLSRLSRERAFVKRTATVAVAIIAFIVLGDWYLTPRSTGIQIDAHTNTLRGSSLSIAGTSGGTKKSNNIRHSSRSPASSVETVDSSKPIEILHVNPLRPAGTEIAGK